ncbi:hypothetical protein BKA69DRAFT_1125581 [Paraphysoderma sedebokerense]|nr:hypothetical protein BKA69DRAFT_1125581 [Paraphysoderma sedebokerense]
MPAQKPTRASARAAPYPESKTTPKGQEEVAAKPQAPKSPKKNAKAVSQTPQPQPTPEVKAQKAEDNAEVMSKVAVIPPAAPSVSTSQVGSSSSQSQLSPTSKIVGRKISKPAKTVVQEMKKISSYSGVKPQEVVGRLANVPVKKTVVEQVHDLGQSGLVNIVPSKISGNKKAGNMK